jgi:lipid II:glycine glycyltransferase (peptidoglycan interpeptide bridge formation enzyme)
MRSVLVDETNIERYRPALESFHREIADLHFEQTLGWYTCQAKQGDSLFVLALDGEKVTASSLIRRRSIPVLGYAVYRIERGPVCPDPPVLTEHLSHIVDVVREDGILLRASPYYRDRAGEGIELELRGHGWRPVADSLAPYKSTVVVDLARDESSLKSELRRSLRTQLNKGQRLGVRITDRSGPEEFKVFVAQYNEMARTRHLAAISPHMETCLQHWLQQSPCKAKLITAEYQGEQVAGIVLLSAGNRVIYEWGVSSDRDDHRQLPLTHMLHWHAILWARGNGYRYYDFGGYWEARGDADPINRFKTGFSKEIQRFFPEHVLLLKPLAARSYLALARAKARMGT